VTVWSIVVQVAAIGLIVAVAFTVIGWVIAPERRPSTPLERAQAGVLAVGAVALGLSKFMTSEPIDVIWVIAVYMTAALAVARRRRGEPLLPG
jgi:hypothetical protein